MDEATRRLLESFRGREVTVYWALGEVPQMTRGTLAEFGECWVHLTQPRKGQAEPAHWYVRADQLVAVSDGVSG